MQFYSFFTAVFLLEFVDDISLNNVANFFLFLIVLMITVTFIFELHISLKNLTLSF